MCIRDRSEVAVLLFHHLLGKDVGQFQKFNFYLWVLGFERIEDGIETVSYTHLLAKEGMKLTSATVYGVYNQEGDSVDSSIQTTVYVNDETKEVVFIDFVEALLPVSARCV